MFRQNDPENGISVGALIFRYLTQPQFRLSVVVLSGHRTRGPEGQALLLPIRQPVSS